jgi:hypothetical protein
MVKDQSFSTASHPGGAPHGGAYEPPYLYHKSRLVTENFPYYAEQVAFDAALESLSEKLRRDYRGCGP